MRTFETVENVRRALLEFKRLYNEHWILERVGIERQPRPEKALAPPWRPRHDCREFRVRETDGGTTRARVAGDGDLRDREPKAAG